MPFINRLLHWARTEPDRAAVVVGDTRMTYGELADRAACLQLPAGEMIGLLIDHPADFVVAFTAVVGRGRCAAVLDSGWPDDLRHRILDALKPDAVLTSTGLAQTPAGAYVDRTALSDAPADARFYCGFTSGTSGVPKGFVRTVGSWSRSLERSVDWFGLTPGLRVFAPGQLAASLTLYALAESLYSGSTFHTAPPGTPTARGPAMAQVLRSERIEHLIGVPSALRLALGRSAGELPYLRTVVSGGAKLSAAETAIIRRRAPAARVFEYYGASELSLVTVRRADGAAGDDVGHPFPGVEIRIDADDIGDDIADDKMGKHGGTGTVQVLTDTAIEGYLFGDDGRAFQRHGNWVTVQDRGWIDDDGALHLTGRHGDMVVVAGTNVYPAEIETVLVQAGYPAAVVLGIPDEHRGSFMAAVIEAPPETVLDAVQLRSRLKEALPAVKVPQRVFRTVCLPLTAAGKPDRMALEAAVRAGGGGGVLEPVS